MTDSAISGAQRDGMFGNAIQAKGNALASMQAGAVPQEASVQTLLALSEELTKACAQTGARLDQCARNLGGGYRTEADGVSQASPGPLDGEGVVPATVGRLRFALQQLRGMNEVLEVLERRIG